MPRKPEGSVGERSDRPGLWARVTYTDGAGRKRVIQRKVANRTEGKRLLKELLASVEDRGEAAVEGDKLTFRALAKVYEEKELIPPVYRNEEKVAGKRDYKNQRRILARLVEHFGARLVKSISYAEISAYRTDRLNTPVQTKKKTSIIKERSIADVNRHLTLLRSVLNYAWSSGWLARNPFEQGHQPLIRTSVERKRERIITYGEEARLLAACVGFRHHLKPIVLFALDTGARRSEILGLTWGDVDLTGGTVTLRSHKGRVTTSRLVGLTPRLKDELERLQASGLPGADRRIFGIKTNFSRSWNAVRKEAKLHGVRFHDLRHTAITRMVQAGVPSAIVMSISGHSVFTTFKRYVNANQEAAIEGAEALARLHTERQIDEQKPASEFVN